MNIFICILNILLPPLTLVTLLFLQLPFYVFKLLSYVVRSKNSENVAGKVVVVTGAASGIGKQVACEYARRGSFLVIVDVNKEGLGSVARECVELGSPDVITVGADVSKIEDCKLFVDKTIHHFGRLDHLVNNAGIHKLGLLGSGDVSNFTSVMDVNFWGCVYGTHFAIPHLKKSRGKVVVISSICGVYPIPSLGFYNASKAALISFYQTLKAEMGSKIGITIVTPGFIGTEMTKGEKEQEGIGSIVPMETARECAESIVKGACRGDRFLSEPSFISVLYMVTVLCPPELIEWCNHYWFVTRIRNKRAARIKILQSKGE